MDNLDKNQIFREWVNQYYEYGFRVAFKIIGNEEDCRDIVQDAFLKVWIRFDTYDVKLKFTTWFFTIVSNLCYDRLRKNKTAANYADSIAIKSNNITESPEKDINEMDVRRTLNKLSENLSPKQKIVFVLRDLEEMEIDEVCVIAKMDPEQVKANLCHARKAIRKSLTALKLLEERI